MPLTLPGVELPPLSLRLTDHVWGLDISTRRIALGVIQGHGAELAPEVGWFSHEVEQLGGGTGRLAGLLQALPEFFARVATVAPPAAILAEQPYGQGKARPHPQSYYVVGVVLAVLADAFPTATIDVVEPTSWKAVALGEGSGFATKPVVLAWAKQTVDYTGDCPKCHGHGVKKCDHACRAHDEADSLGVATSAAIRWCDARRLR